jgi:hypothetical protein
MFINKLLLKIKSKIKNFKDEKQLELKNKKRKIVDDFLNHKTVKLFFGKTEKSNSFLKKNPVDDLEKKKENVGSSSENLKGFEVLKEPFVVDFDCKGEKKK